MDTTSKIRSSADIQEEAWATIEKVEARDRFVFTQEDFNRALEIIFNGGKMADEDYRALISFRRYRLSKSRTRIRQLGFGFVTPFPAPTWRAFWASPDGR